MIEGISQSYLNMASRCPEQFRRRYLNNEILPPAVAAVRGTAVHRGAQTNHHHIKDTGEPLPKSDIVDATATAYMAALREGVSMTSDEAQDKAGVLGKAKDEAVALAGLYADKVSPSIREPRFVEQKIELDVGLDVPLFGTIDLLHDRNRIVDLKTASKKKSEDFGVGNLQAAQYTMLARSVIDEQPSFEFKFLVANKTPIEQTIQAVVQDTDELALLARARALLLMIHKGVFPPANPDDWYCSADWCGYHSTCPYVSHPRIIHTNGLKNQLSKENASGK